MGLFYNYDRYKILDEGVPTENLYSHFGMDCQQNTRGNYCLTYDRSLRGHAKGELDVHC